MKRIEAKRNIFFVASYGSLGSKCKPVAVRERWTLQTKVPFLTSSEPFAPKQQE